MIEMPGGLVRLEPTRVDGVGQWVARCYHRESSCQFAIPGDTAREAEAKLDEYLAAGTWRADLERHRAFRARAWT